MRRSTCRYKSCAKDARALRQRLRELAEARRRFGYQRSQPSTKQLIDEILAKPEFASCTGQPAARARCAMERMVSQFSISGWNVRYDEGHRNVAKMRLDNLVEVDSAK